MKVGMGWRMVNILTHWVSLPPYDWDEGPPLVLLDVIEEDFL
jgi:hypothetical protein